MHLSGSFRVISSFVHPDVHLWGSLAYFPHSCTQTCISAVHLIRASFRRALNVRRLEMIFYNHLISLLKYSLVYIYCYFSQFSKWIQYMRLSIYILLIYRRVTCISLCCQKKIFTTEQGDIQKAYSSKYWWCIENKI